MKPGRSVSGRKASSSTLKLILSTPGVLQVTANIFSPTEKTRSSPHLVSSVAPGRPRHSCFARFRFIAVSYGLSGQPPFAAAIEFLVAEALAPCAGDAQIELLDVLVGGQVGGGTLHHHPAVFQDVAEV